jgi:HAD superfamily hydrolase (TIGR01484 family)
LDMLEKLKKLTKHYQVSFSSGRAMDYLENIYADVLGDNVSLQAEIGMYIYINKLLITNYELRIEQKEKLNKIRQELEKIKDKKIKGFEPKEYLITLHCQDKIEEIDDIVKKIDLSGELFCWWNGEAYDIGLKVVNKGTGLKLLTEKLGVKMSQVMTVGNGINDANMTDIVGIDVSTDRKHLQADFAVWGEEIGGEKVVDRILKLTEG